MNKFFPMTHYEFMMNSVYGVSDTIQKIFKKFGKEPMDFLDFSEQLMTISEFATITALTGPDNGNMAIRFVYHMWRMWSTGERIFYVSKNLCDMLSHTDLTIDASFIQAPFEEIYIYTDQDDIKMSDYSGTRAMKGIYVNLKTDERQQSRMLRFLATSGSDGILENTDVNHFAGFVIPEHGRLEDIVNRQMVSFQETAKKTATIGRGPVDLDVIIKIFKFTVNVLLYITSKGADVENVQPFIPQSKSPKKLRKYQNKAKLPFVYVGKNIERPKSSIKGSGNRITHKFWVSGHWREQWVGSVKDGTRKQKSVWIKPYEKGKELAETISKKYIVKE